jgi:hypothetical protein
MTPAAGPIAAGSRRPASRTYAIGAGTSAIVQVFGRRDDDTIHALLQPASKKRQSTKSREVGHAAHLRLSRRGANSTYLIMPRC